MVDTLYIVVVLVQRLLPQECSGARGPHNHFLASYRLCASFVTSVYFVPVGWIRRTKTFYFLDLFHTLSAPPLPNFLYRVSNTFVERNVEKVSWLVIFILIKNAHTSHSAHEKVSEKVF